MMTAEQLKNSILQLAMQGKLVEQKPEEGTGEELYREIQAVKKRLVKEGKIKKQKPLPEITQDEIPFEIPESWKWVKLGEIVDFSMGKTPPRADLSYWGEDIPWISIADMEYGGTIYGTKESITYKALNDCFKGQISPKGTLIMSFKLTVGKVSILGFDAVHNEAIISVFPFINEDNILRDYLRQMLPFLSTYGKSKKAIKGFTLNSTSLNNIPVPLPPLAEQKRIVAKIEELMPFVDQYAAASTKLNTLNALFPEMMKKSILQEAVQGKLVPQDPNDEPASVLLKKIAEEKKSLIKEEKIRKDKKESVIFRGDDGVFYETIGKKTICIQDQIPFSIPETWEWIRLRTYGQFSSGKTPSMANPNNWNGNIPWVTPKDMKTEIIQDSQMHISKEASEEMTLYPKGTLLMVVRSGILKRMLPLCILGIDSTINQDLKAFTFYDNELSEWIYYELKGFEHYILHNLVKNVAQSQNLWDLGFRT